MIKNVPYRRSKSTNCYIDKAMLEDEVQKCIANGRTCSDELAKYFYLIVSNMQKAANFSSYSRLWKQQMADFAMTKLLKSMKTVDLSKCQNIFNYYSRTTYLAFLTQIARLKREDAKLKNYKTKIKELNK